MSLNQPGTVFDTIPANTFQPHKPLETIDGRPVRNIGRIAGQYRHVVAMMQPDGTEVVYGIDSDGMPDPASRGLQVVCSVKKEFKPYRLARDRRHVLTFEEPGEGRLGGTEIIATFDVVFIGWQFVGFENVNTSPDPDPR